MTPRILMTSRLTALLLASGLAITAVGQEPAPAQDPAPSQPAEAKADPTQALIDAMNADNNGLTIDREQGVIDITGKVCLRQAEFLEMLACTPDSREHESLIVLDTMPSTIHTALLLLGLEPGAPAKWEQNEGDPDFKMVPPQGPQVEVLIRYEKDGETVEVPANQWVLNQKTSKPMEGSTWVFAGSKIVDYEGQQIYVADAYGTALSLVNFGDDLLARNVAMSDSNDSHEQTWGANTEAIPNVGTKVVLRLKTRVPADNEVKPDAPAEEAAPAPAE